MMASLPAAAASAPVAPSAPLPAADAGGTITSGGGEQAQPQPLAAAAAAASGDPAQPGAAPAESGGGAESSSSAEGGGRSQQRLHQHQPAGAVAGAVAGAASASSAASTQSGLSGEQTISYSAERIIGNGSFGVVFQAAVVETGEIVAIKKVLQDKRFKNRELQIMRQLVKDPHSNIVGLKHCFYSQVRN